MRNACGSNDHPNSAIFLQVYRLIGTYSLIKPPKGSNVSGSEMLNMLLDCSINNSENDKKMVLFSKLDEIIENSVDLVEVPSLLENVTDHTYNAINSNEVIIGYFSGYVARRAAKFSSCTFCLTSLVAAKSDERHELLINVKNRGGLLSPSESLYNLISLLEEATLRTVTDSNLNVNSLSDIISNIDGMPLPLVGCPSHSESLTKSLIHFFLITRMHFLCDRSNKIDKIKDDKTRKYRKLSKL
nr:uncharacterized protein LOC122271815 [Parasteatoda tepidariorum]